MRRILPVAAILIGARLLFGNFLMTTAKRESFFFDNYLTPLGLVLVVAGAYFLMKDYE
jgi:hypothetical protein